MMIPKWLRITVAVKTDGTPMNYPTNVCFAVLAARILETPAIPIVILIAWSA
jgi:hypothetical protein